MTALTANRDVPRLADVDYPLVGAPVLAGVHIYEGALVVIDVNGYAKPGGNAPAATDKCAGVSTREYDNTAGASGNLWATIRPGVFGFVNDGNVVIGDLFKKLWVKDDQTVAHADQTAGFAGSCYAPLGIVSGAPILPVSAAQATDNLVYVAVGIPLVF